SASQDRRPKIGVPGVGVRRRRRGSASAGPPRVCVKTGCLVCGRRPGLWTAGGTVGASVAGSTPSTAAADADASAETRCLVTTLPLRPLPPRVPQPPPERGAGSVDARARTPGRGSGRPLLPAALRPVWRSDQALQLGLDPDRAVVVDGIDEQIAKTLLGLDGTRTEAEVLAGAAETGLDPDLVEDLLTDLRTAGVLAEISSRPAAGQPPPGAGAVEMPSWPRMSPYGA